MPGRGSRPVARLVGTVAGLVILAAVAVPLVGLDRYRRADLRGRTDGPFVLAFSRDSLAFARRLEAGRPVMYEPAARLYLPGRSDPRHMERMRWFLREGFGERPEYGMEEVASRSRRPPWSCPCSSPGPSCWASSSAPLRPTPVRVSVNGTFLGTVTAAPLAQRERLTVPAQALFRGDNRLALEHPGRSAPRSP